MGNGNGVMVKSDRATVMGSLSERYSMDAGKLLETIKATCIKGNASNEQVQAFLIVANRYGLDPFLKEIHAFAGQGGGIVPIVGIDGWSKIANSRPDFDGCEFTFEGDGDGMACTATVYVKGRAHPVRVTEYMSECGRNTPPWKQYPRRMLRHKSFMQCVRIAFGLGGIFDEDEAKDVINNEQGQTTVTRRIDALNAAVVPHPTDDTRTIDTRDNNLPADEQQQHDDAGEEQRDAEPDVEGAQAEPPADVRGHDELPVEMPDLSTWEKFYAAMVDVYAGSNRFPTTKEFDAFIAKVQLHNPVRRETTAAIRARQDVYAAAVRNRLTADGKVQG